MNEIVKLEKFGRLKLGINDRHGEIRDVEARHSLEGLADYTHICLFT